MRSWRIVALVWLCCGVSQAQSSLPGLVASCKDSRHSVQWVVPSADFLLDPTESIHPALEPAFECEWRGSVEILQGGRYRFDRAGARLWFGDGEVGEHPQSFDPGVIPIRIQYRRGSGAAGVRILWQSERFDWEPLSNARLTHSTDEEPAAGEVLISRGRRLVEEYGCTNCHATGSGQLEARQAPSLSRVGSRLKHAWLARWLEDPKAVRNDARMPRMLSREQQRDVVRYLAGLGIPQRAGEKPAQQDIDRGRALSESLGCRACHGDGGVSLDGVGAKFERAALVEYLKRPAEFEPSGRMPSMLLDEGEAGELAAFLIPSTDPAEESAAGGDAQRGKHLVAASGCLACHTLEDSGAVSNQLQAIRWEKVRAGQGCLSDASASTPRYGLSSDERQAIEAFLASSKKYPDVSAAPVFAFREAVERLQCGACHTIDQMRPKAQLAENPPPLTDAGAKLRVAWTEGVLTGYNRVLNWFELRMPHYEPAQVRNLLTGFRKASGVEADHAASAAPEEKLSARGRDLLGTNSAKGGMGCIGCHDWGEHDALGEHGPQLINASQRLRDDWFHRWMMNPARILSGTSMPNYFSSTEPGKAQETLAALWAAFEAGNGQPAPEGFDVDTANDPEAKPVPTDQAIVVRWDMPEATPASIAVGLPGGVSYCFDAGESRLRYAWSGGFVDLSRTLTKKSDPETHLSYTAEIVGDIFFRSENFPIRVGSMDAVPQRRFRGYRLVQGFPEFHYLVENLDVREKLSATSDGAGLIREFRFAHVEGPVWLLAEPGDAVSISSSVGDPAKAIEVPQGDDVLVTLTIHPKQ